MGSPPCPATRSLRCVKPKSLLPPPENPQAAPLFCRLPLKGGVMEGLGAGGMTSGKSPRKKALETPMKCPCKGIYILNCTISLTDPFGVPIYIVRRSPKCKVT